MGSFNDRAEQHLGRLRSAMDYTSIDDIIQQGLHEFIDHFQSELNRAGDAIHTVFFALPPQRGMNGEQKVLQ